MATTVNVIHVILQLKNKLGSLKLSIMHCVPFNNFSNNTIFLIVKDLFARFMYMYYGACFRFPCCIRLQMQTNRFGKRTWTVSGTESFKHHVYLRFIYLQTLILAHLSTTCSWWAIMVSGWPSCVAVRRPSSVNIWCLHYRDHICDTFFYETWSTCFFAISKASSNIVHIG